MAFKLKWDQDTEREYSVGCDRGVIYPLEGGKYQAGAAWNGLISVTESPSGAEPTALYANNRKYGELLSAEEFGGTIEAYMYPDEFGACNGEVELAPGVTVTQQTRKPFGMTYRETIGNDSDAEAYGYKIHLVYGAKVSPSERTHTTINDSPEAETMSWEFTTTPIEIAGMKPSAHIIIESTKFVTEEAKTKLATFEKLLYGTAKEGETAEVEAALPTPAQLVELFKAASEPASEG